jgi:replicative superfamily II helicase
MIDFSKRLAKKSLQDPHDPVKIYETLDRQVDKGPLRPAQHAILSDWHTNRRHVRDVVIKLHTGQGKTLIGLLLLQSKLNEGLGPALYICPNKFLANQTCLQAEQFGVAVCQDDGDLPQEFLDGKKILVTHVQKVFNGQSQFKLGARSIAIGTLVVDDAHACVDSIRDACVIKLKSDTDSYKQLLTVFSSALESQGAGTLTDIRNGNRDAILPVPYWAWQEKQTEVLAALEKVTKRPTNRQEKPHGAWFVWPLIKDNLKNCQCVIGGKSLEIAPYLPPLDAFGSFFSAKHRVFMSATVTNDSFLVRGLQLEPATLRNPLALKDEKWSGEKMLLLPSLIDPSLDRNSIVNKFGTMVPRRTYGVVALTPSFNAAEFWGKCGAVVVKPESIDDEVGRLRRGECEKTLAFASRYDGIDLPDSSCRILIFDSLPHASNLIDAYEEHCRISSNVSVMQVARRIEQGLGRSVRGEKDYSVIIITGPELVRMVRSQRTKQFLSAQTRMQIDIGHEIAELARSADSKDAWNMLNGVINQCLKRDQGWKDYYAEQMDQVTPAGLEDKELDIFAMELEAELAAQHGDPRKAVTVIRRLMDELVKDPADQGWYLQEIARYALAYSKSESNDLQIVAHKKNRYVMRPANGMIVDKIELLSQKRIENIRRWIADHGSFDELRLAVDDILGRLEFGTKADRFESAFQELGRALGFESQRPDKEWKAGPDNLWAVRDGEYFVVECKSEVDEQRPEINKDESGQMNNACAWFEKNYPGAKATRILIIPTKKVAKAAGFNEHVIILRRAGLRKLVGAVRAFINEFASLDFKDLSLESIQKCVDAHSLGVDAIRERCEQTV